jgi:predicted O-methyltransferase YrrM
VEILRTAIRQPIVQRANQYATACGFTNSCAPEVGELLHILVGQFDSGRIAEIGTGCGVGTAWMVSAINSNVEVFSIDNDEERVAGVNRIFDEYPHVHILSGDWKALLKHGPFRFIFVDAKPAKLEGIEQILDAMTPSGLVLLDDFTPLEFWPDEWQGKPDVVRETWLNHPRLSSMEVRTSLKASVILGRKLF